MTYVKRLHKSRFICNRILYGPSPFTLTVQLDSLDE